jgi:uncharacterized protein YeaO (DUF488 family)
MPPGKVTTRRWNDPAVPGEGTRILVTVYRPRGVPKKNEPWDEWQAALGPSRALHAAVYGKGQDPIDFEEYRERFLRELQSTRGLWFLRGLRERLARGENLALLCSSACEDETKCHRSILRALLLA